MDDLETQCLSLLNFEVPVFYRYVDDIFMIVPKTEIHTVLGVFNGYHPHLKFTHEIEKQSSIPFLDIIIIRENNVLTTNWYRKPTFSGRYMNFFSNHPLNYKKITNLVDRAILLSDNSTRIISILLKKFFEIIVTPHQLLTNKLEKDSKIYNIDKMIGILITEIITLTRGTAFPSLLPKNLAKISNAS